MRLGGIVLLIATAAWGGEFAVFAAGTRLHIDRHEVVDGARVRLYSGAGFTELNAAQLRGFEEDDVATAGPVRLEPAPASAPAANAAQDALAPKQLADAAADKYGLPRKLVRSVMAAESGFEPQAVSPKGAVGLMQLMPATAQLLGAEAGDPPQNVDAATRYLRDLLLKYDGALWHALAAYNAGPGAVDKYKNIPPYGETIRYIGRVDRELKKID
jgi:soluble lytic murein transglycosylase-like protein